MVETFALCLLASLAFACLMRGWHMAFASLILTGNWAACFAWAKAFPHLAMEPFPLAAFDAVSALILVMPALKRRAPGWYLVIVSLYICQLFAHIARMLVPNSEWDYWVILSALAWLQVAAVWAGGGYDVGRAITGVLGDMGLNRTSDTGLLRATRDEEP